MFLCDCPHCGRRELRGPRSLTVSTDTASAGAFVATCRGCGATVGVAGHPTPQHQPAPIAA